MNVRRGGKRRSREKDGRFM